MPMHHKARGGNGLHIARAGMNIKHLVACAAVEMMVVRMSAEFVAGWLAGQLNRLNFFGLCQEFDIAVHRCQPKGRHDGACQIKNFYRQKRALGKLQGLAYGVALSGGAFHGVYFFFERYFSTLLAVMV